jgi:hypothetical protein
VKFCCARVAARCEREFKILIVLEVVASRSAVVQGERFPTTVTVHSFLGDSRLEPGGCPQ